MNAELCTHAHVHHLGESATQPIEPRYGTPAGLQAVLLLLAGKGPQRRHALLARTLHDWLLPLDELVPEADPAQALEAYVRAKMAMSALRPQASKVFANELLHGAPVLGDLMRGELRRAVAAKAAVIDGWIAAGRMAPVDSTHLFFTLWAATQTYADFDLQVAAVLGRSTLSASDHRRATEHVVSLILRGCGLA